jgi:hypothetical protein
MSGALCSTRRKCGAAMAAVISAIGRASSSERWFARLDSTSSRYVGVHLARRASLFTQAVATVTNVFPDAACLAAFFTAFTRVR